MFRCGIFQLLITTSVLCVLATQAAAQTNGPPRAAGWNNPQLYVLLEENSHTLVAARKLAADHRLPLDLDGLFLPSLGKRAFIANLSERGSHGGQTIAALMKQLRLDPRIAVADVVSEFSVLGGPAKGTSTPRAGADLGDPYAPLQHAHITTSVTQSQRIASGAGVKVAVIDTGVDAKHVDLENQIVQHLNFVGPEQDSTATEFHATAVAGIIGAEANNGVGVIGVAPGSRLFVLRACVETNPGSSRGKCSSLALARALDWAIVNEMQLINMSVQGQDDELVSRLIQKAVSEGIVVVAATDLTNGQLAFPAKLAEVIAVSDQESNSLVGLAAHSQRIFIAPGEEILTTLPNDTYDFVTGASFAAAHVTGIIALIMEKAPSLTPAEITALLRDSVRVINWGIIVDSCSALALLGGDINCRSFR
jgi:subtilisin family serine protease